MLECGNTVSFKVTQQYRPVAQGTNPAESAALAQLWVGAKAQACSFVGWGKQDPTSPSRGSEESFWEGEGYNMPCSSSAFLHERH